jgi:hypothetical protein
MLQQMEYHNILLILVFWQQNHRVFLIRCILLNKDQQTSLQQAGLYGLFHLEPHLENKFKLGQRQMLV